MASTKPLGNINVTFLGTASAAPSSTRNHSALALRLDGDVWLFDCGEATQHQLQKSSVKMGRIQKIFITHTHGDHMFGVVPLLCSLLNGAGGTTEGSDDPRINVDKTLPPVEIYGPLGLRAYVRGGLTYSHSLIGSPYVVHELRFPSDPTTDPTYLPLHPAELEGRNMIQTDGIWTNMFSDDRVSVSAAPILHSCPCVGYVVQEAPVPGKMDPKLYIPHIKRTGAPMSAMARLQQGESVSLPDGTVLHGPARRPGRKLAILGDTYDPSPIAGLAADADLLIHEATNAHLPGVDPNTKLEDTYETVEARAKSRGHSTPQMAGAFARLTGAKRLVLNHFSSRYPGDDSNETRDIMGAIGRHAESEYGQPVTCARDLMSFDVGLIE
ncbi:beta-lactamase-like protein [Schizophyllum amplum]|uniref:Beta-lactamase-like protein n=1 Tax=Schizophyllum amplum TaxID=97359 RepID=A0A550CS62_9AGAR|nr:beta-lactamase-like protein [Auriculariopsis ampla]